MLVLTRKLKEQIHIGDNITVRVLAIKGGSVRIGIEAPRDVRVRRDELPPLKEEMEGTLSQQSLAMEAPLADRMRSNRVSSATAKSTQPIDGELDNRVIRRPLRRFDSSNREQHSYSAGRAPLVSV